MQYKYIENIYFKLHFQNLQDFIDSATDGVILFSFGSIVNLSNLPNEKLSAFLNVISRLKQKVIIKWVPDESVKLPQNVMTGSWLPQNDILGNSLSFIVMCN